MLPTWFLLVWLVPNLTVFNYIFSLRFVCAKSPTNRKKKKLEIESVFLSSVVDRRRY